MNRPLLLDLFCGAGGCSEGYYRAGFAVVGVDNQPQPHYPYAFIQADAMDYVAQFGHRYDVIHASPPCQGYSVMAHLSNGTHPMIIPQVRELLKSSGKLYVIENVPGAPLICPLVLCGTMFNLTTTCGAQLRRHRLFESNVPLSAPGPCRHADRPIGVQGHTPFNEAERMKIRKGIISVNGSGQPLGGRVISVYGDGARDPRGERERYRPHTISVTGSTPQEFKRDRYPVEEARIAMGIDWMPMKYLSQAIPPAYTAHIGRQLINHFTL